MKRLSSDRFARNVLCLWVNYSNKGSSTAMAGDDGSSMAWHGTCMCIYVSRQSVYR